MCTSDKIVLTAGGEYNHYKTSAVTGGQYVYWDFPDVIKFRIAALIRYRTKQSGSGIWS